MFSGLNIPWAKHSFFVDGENQLNTSPAQQEQLRGLSTQQIDIWRHPTAMEHQRGLVTHEETIGARERVQREEFFFVGKKLKRKRVRWRCIEKKRCFFHKPFFSMSTFPPRMRPESWGSSGRRRLVDLPTVSTSMLGVAVRFWERFLICLVFWSEFRCPFGFVFF